jgi:hypothetical protein
MVLNGVFREVQLSRDLGRAEPVEDALRHLTLPSRQAVGGDDERRDLGRSCGLEDDGRSPLLGIADD